MDVVLHLGLKNLSTPQPQAPTMDPKMEAHCKHAPPQHYDTSTWDKLHTWLFHLEGYFTSYPSVYPDDGVKVWTTASYFKN